MVDSSDGVVLGHVPSDSCLRSGLIFLEVICPFAQEIATGSLFGFPKASAFFCCCCYFDHAFLPIESLVF